MSEQPLELLTNGPDDASRTLILAHGAGAGMRSEWMERIASAIALHAIRVIRFEFSYMAARSHGGKSGAPDPGPRLEWRWEEVIAAVGGPSELLIGGKSMGGRIASMVADRVGVRGLICLGYPFHPPGQPARVRTAHLASLKTPALIIQGERDPFGTREDVALYHLSDAITIEWMTDGDHGFVPRKKSGVSAEQNFERAVALVAERVNSA